MEISALCCVIGILASIILALTIKCRELKTEIKELRSADIYVSEEEPEDDWLDGDTEIDFRGLKVVSIERTSYDRALLGCLGANGEVREWTIPNIDNEIYASLLSKFREYLKEKNE